MSSQESVGKTSAFTKFPGYEANQCLGAEDIVGTDGWNIERKAGKAQFLALTEKLRLLSSFLTDSGGMLTTDGATVHGQCWPSRARRAQCVLHEVAVVGGSSDAQNT